MADAGFLVLPIARSSTPDGSDLMGFFDAARTCLSKYATFSGRAARPEYWYFVLFIVVGSVAFAIVDGLLFGIDPATGRSRSVLGALFQLATFLPLLAAGWRRMHDTGRPGWLLLLPFLISVGGAIAMLSGVVAFGTLEAGGADPNQLQGPAALLGLTGLFAIGAVQLVLLILMIWWLTRPTEAGTNRYGPEP